MKSKLPRFFSKLHHDDCGAMSVEKILILALISIPLLLLLIVFKNTIIGWFNGQSGQLTDPGTTPTGG